MTLPASSVISAVRRSHSSWSKGFFLGSLKTRLSESDFLGGEAGCFTVRVAVTVPGRRRVAETEADRTSCVASIMISLTSDFHQLFPSPNLNRKNYWKW